MTHRLANPIRCNAARRRRRALVLILVLVVVVVLSLSAYSFTALMVAERRAAILSGRQVQARALVDSGVDAVRLFLAQDEQTQVDLGGTYDNPAMFQGVPVLQDADTGLQGLFSVIAPALDGDGRYAGVRFGLEDESTRLNLNALLLADEQEENGGRQLLMGLPGMTEEIADAILDWIDEDDEPRELGAEIDYYSGLNPPYAPKNGPLDSVEELLLVRGVTPQLLFGADADRNGILDPSEQSGAAAAALAEAGVDNSDGSLDRGWAAYLTLYSQERNVASDGLPRIYVNTDDMQQLYDDLAAALDERWATFIVAYRQNGPYTGNEQPSGDAGGTLDLSRPAQVPLVQLLDLVDQKVRVTFQGDDEPTVLASPLQQATLATDLPLIMDKLTTVQAPTIPGRININQAPRVILEGIPGMDLETANEIISRRDVTGSQQDPNRQYETWLLTEGVVDLDTMRQLMPFVCAGGDVYRAQVVGYYQGAGAAARVEVVFDATEAMPRILFWRDIGHLGRGFDAEQLGAPAAP